MSQSDPEAFNAYERAAWNVAAPAYLEGFGSLVRQSIDRLLEGLELTPGARVLDVACGSGFVSAAATARGATAVGIDASSAMLHQARSEHPDAAFHLGNAESLPFADGEFDAVACNYGMLHFGRPERALAEAFRVLKPGGSVGFTVWAAPPATTAFEIVLRAVERLGKTDVGLPPGPPFFRFSDATEAARALQDAGFSEAKSETIPQTWRLTSAEELFEIMRDGTGRTRGLLLGQSESALANIREAIIEATRAYVRDDAVLLPMPSVLSLGRKGHGS